MVKQAFLLTLIIMFSVRCSQPKPSISTETENQSAKQGLLNINEYSKLAGNGALLLTRFRSLDELKQVIRIEYADTIPHSSGNVQPNSFVRLTYQFQDRHVTSILKPGVTETDFRTARDGDFWDRVKLGLHSPYAVVNRKNLASIERLGRRRPWVYGKGDVAFYDLAETMVNNISDDDIMSMSSEDFSEKGYLNTFNHIAAQAFMTTIYNEALADFVGDVHERSRMPELITGKFSEDQLTDLEDGALDNYIDLINNEWGQDLGKLLRLKYKITRQTHWTPSLLTNYLNDIQSYFSWAFQIGFKPFRPSDEVVIRFAGKLNAVI